MIRGSGNTGRITKIEAAVAATVTGARSGTSLVGTFVELGGAGANPLLHLTAIDQAGFEYQHNNGGPRIFRLEANGEFYVGDIDGQTGNSTSLIIQPVVQNVHIESNFNNYLLIDVANQDYSFGDINNAAGGTQLRLVDIAGLAVIDIATNRYLSLDTTNDIYQMGDISLANNQTIISAIDATGQISGSANNATMLLLDQPAGSFQMGDIGIFGLGSVLTVLDGTQTLTFSTLAGGVLDFNLTNGLFLYGDLGGVGNGSTVLLNNPQQQFVFSAAAGRALDCDIANNLYSIGDLDGISSFTSLVVRSANLVEEVEIFANNGLKITNDPVMLHSGSAWGNGAAAAAGTLNNAPVAGNPTKWIPVDDNGIQRFIPAW